NRRSIHATLTKAGPDRRAKRITRSPSPNSTTTLERRALLELRHAGSALELRQEPELRADRQRPRGAQSRRGVAAATFASTGDAERAQTPSAGLAAWIDALPNRRRLRREHHCGALSTTRGSR